MSSRPSRPDTPEINSQAGFAFAGDRSNCSGLVGGFLTVPAGSPSSPPGSGEGSGAEINVRTAGNQLPSRTARLTGTAHLPSRRHPRRGSSLVTKELPPRDHRHARHQNAVLEAPIENVAPVRIAACHLHRG